MKKSNSSENDQPFYQIVDTNLVIMQIVRTSEGIYYGYYAIPFAIA
jgi:hypothetical protein